MHDSTNCLNDSNRKLFLSFFTCRFVYPVAHRDMLARISIWYSMTELGYNLPKREPLHKAELLEEERIRKAILDARARAREEDFDVPCRVIRVFVGFKQADALEVEVDE